MNMKQTTLFSSLRGEPIKPAEMLSALPLSDVIDMIARLKAAELVWNLLVANGMVIEDEQGVRETMQQGQAFLQEEAEQRFKAMRERADG